MKNYITIFSGHRLYVDELDSLRLAQNGIYEPNETQFIRSFVKSNHVVLDVGAHIGYYTVLMAAQCERVFAIEPYRNNFALLNQNIMLNNLHNVTAINKAASAENGKATLHLCDINSGMHRLYETGWAKAHAQVETLRVDEVAERVDFIKMDIEGAEYGALKGMRRLLEKRIPILMEFHPPSIREYGVEPRAVYDLMLSYDYHVSLPDREISYSELEELATKWSGINILCT